MLVAVVLLLPLIACAPSPPPTSTEDLVNITDTFYCLRQCFGMNNVIVEPTAGEQRCMRLVDSRSLWDTNTSEITIEGPRRGVYSTRIISSPSLSISLKTVGIDHTMPSDGAYSQCVRKCLDIDSVAPEECKDGQREFGLITSGKEDGYDWSAFYGYGCQTIHAIITTYEEEIPILIDDGDVGLFLHISDGKMNAKQITFEKKEEETSTDSSEVDEEDKESTTVATDDYDDDEEGTEDPRIAQNLAKWLPCPLGCVYGKYLDQLEWTPLAIKQKASDDGGNWWYDRYTFRDAEEKVIATMIDHDAKTRIRFVGELIQVGSNVSVLSEKMATCLSDCFDEEYKELFQSCSESALIPTWTIVEGRGVDEEGWSRMTIAIPHMSGDCHSLTTFAVSPAPGNFKPVMPIRILYARDEEEVFSIEDERAISRIIYTTNSSLLNADSD